MIYILFISIAIYSSRAKVCNDFDGNISECRSQNDLKCQYMSNQKKCNLNHSSELGCLNTLSRLLCLQQGKRHTCIFQRGLCTTAGQREIEKMNCKDHFSMGTCLSNKFAPCRWKEDEQKCAEVSQVDAECSRCSCSQFYDSNKVNPLACSRISLQKCVYNEMEDKCIETDPRYQKVKCNDPGVSQVTCQAIITSEESCFYDERYTCRSATKEDLELLDCTSRVNINTCLNLTSQPCQWLDECLPACDWNSQELMCKKGHNVIIKNVNLVACRNFESFPVKYDKSEKSCVLFDAKHHNDSCDELGLNSEACMMIKSKSCVFRFNRCEEVKQIEFQSLKCKGSIALNRKACIHVEMEGQFCQWNEEKMSCEEFSLQDLKCDNKKLKNVNPVTCKNIAAEGCIFHKNEEGSYCEQTKPDSEVCDSNSKRFNSINRKGCLEITQTHQRCQWANDRCIQLEKNQRYSSCSEFSNVNPNVCASLNDGNEGQEACMHDSTTLSCKTLTTEESEKLNCETNWGLNSKACSLISTKGQICIYREDVCQKNKGEKSKEVGYINQSCSQAGKANAQFCARIKSNNEPCQYSYINKGCVRNIDTRDKKCLTPGLNLVACMTIKDANCRFNEQTYECETAFQSSECTQNLNYNACVNVASSEQNCRFDHINNKCNQLKGSQLTLPCNQFEHVNWQTCASAFIENVRSDQLHAFTCMYNKDSAKCEELNGEELQKHFQTFEDDYCLTKFLGINAFACVKFGKGECFFHQNRCQDLQIDPKLGPQERAGYIDYKVNEQLRIQCRSASQNICGSINHSSYLCMVDPVTNICTHFKSIDYITDQETIINNPSNEILCRQISKLGIYAWFSSLEGRCKKFNIPSFEDINQNSDDTIKDLKCNSRGINIHTCLGLVTKENCVFDTKDKICKQMSPDDIKNIPCENLNYKGCMEKANCFYDQVQLKCFTEKEGQSYEFPSCALNLMYKFSSQICAKVTQEACHYDPFTYTCLPLVDQLPNCSGHGISRKSCYTKTGGFCKWDQQTKTCFEVEMSTVSEQDCQFVNKNICLSTKKHACRWDNVKEECGFYLPQNLTCQELINTKHFFSELVCKRVQFGVCWFNGVKRTCSNKVCNQPPCLQDSLRADMSCESIIGNVHACLQRTRGSYCTFEGENCRSLSFQSVSSQDRQEKVKDWLKNGIRINRDICIELTQDINPYTFNMETSQCEEFSQTDFKCFEAQATENGKLYNKAVCAKASSVIGELVASSQICGKKVCQPSQYCVYDSIQQGCAPPQLIIGIQNCNQERLQINDCDPYYNQATCLQSSRECVFKGSCQRFQSQDSITCEQLSVGACSTQTVLACYLKPILQKGNEECQLFDEKFYLCSTLNQLKHEDDQSATDAAQEQLVYKNCNIRYNSQGVQVSAKACSQITEEYCSFNSRIMGCTKISIGPNYLCDTPGLSKPACEDSNQISRCEYRDGIGCQLRNLSEIDRTCHINFYLNYTYQDELRFIRNVTECGIRGHCGFLNETQSEFFDIDPIDKTNCEKKESKCLQDCNQTLRGNLTWEAYFIGVYKDLYSQSCSCTQACLRSYTFPDCEKTCKGMENEDPIIVANQCKQICDDNYNLCSAGSSTSECVRIYKGRIRSCKDDHFEDFKRLEPCEQSALCMYADCINSYCPTRRSTCYQECKMNNNAEFERRRTYLEQCKCTKDKQIWLECTQGDNCLSNLACNQTYAKLDTFIKSPEKCYIWDSNCLSTCSRLSCEKEKNQARIDQTQLCYGCDGFYECQKRERRCRQLELGQECQNLIKYLSISRDVCTSSIYQPCRFNTDNQRCELIANSSIGFQECSATFNRRACLEYTLDTCRWVPSANTGGRCIKELAIELEHLTQEDCIYLNAQSCKLPKTGCLWSYEDKKCKALDRNLEQIHCEELQDLSNPTICSRTDVAPCAFLMGYCTYYSYVPGIQEKLPCQYPGLNRKACTQATAGFCYFDNRACQSYTYQVVECEQLNELACIYYRHQPCMWANQDQRCTNKQETQSCQINENDQTCSIQLLPCDSFGISENECITQTTGNCIYEQRCQESMNLNLKCSAKVNQQLCQNLHDKCIFRENKCQDFFFDTDMRNYELTQLLTTLSNLKYGAVCSQIDVDHPLYYSINKKCQLTPPLVDSCDLKEMNRFACLFRTTGYCRFNLLEKRCENWKPNPEANCDSPTEKLNRAACSHIKKACVFREKDGCLDEQDLKCVSANTATRFNCQIKTDVPCKFDPNTSKCVQISESEKNLECQSAGLNDKACIFHTESSYCHFNNGCTAAYRKDFNCTDKVNRKICLTIQNKSCVFDEKDGCKAYTENQCPINKLVNRESCINVQVGVCVYNSDQNSCQSNLTLKDECNANMNINACVQSDNGQMCHFKQNTGCERIGNIESLHYELDKFKIDSLNRRACISVSESKQVYVQFKDNKCQQVDLSKISNCTEMLNINSGEICKYAQDIPCRYDRDNQRCVEVTEMLNHCVLPFPINSKACIEKTSVKCSFTVKEGCKDDSCFYRECSDANIFADCMAVLAPCQWSVQQGCQKSDPNNSNGLGLNRYACYKKQQKHFNEREKSLQPQSSDEIYVFNTDSKNCELRKITKCEDINEELSCIYQKLYPCQWNSLQKRCAQGIFSVTCQNQTQASQLSCQRVDVVGQLCDYKEVDPKDDAFIRYCKDGKSNSDERRFSYCQPFTFSLDQEQLLQGWEANVNKNVCLLQMEDYFCRGDKDLPSKKICPWMKNLFCIWDDSELNGSGRCLCQQKNNYEYEKLVKLECDKLVNKQLCLSIANPNAFCQWKQQRCQSVDSQILREASVNIYFNVNANVCRLLNSNINSRQKLKFYYNSELNYCQEFLKSPLDTSISCGSPGLNAWGCLSLGRCRWNHQWEICTFSKNNVGRLLQRLAEEQQDSDPNCAVEFSTLSICMECTKPVYFEDNQCQPITSATSCSDRVNKFGCLSIEIDACEWDEKLRLCDFFDDKHYGKPNYLFNAKTCEEQTQGFVYYNQTTKLCQEFDFQQNVCTLPGLNKNACIKIYGCAFIDMKCKEPEKNKKCLPVPANYKVCSYADQECYYDEDEKECKYYSAEWQCSLPGISKPGCQSNKEECFWEDFANRCMCQKEKEALQKQCLNSKKMNQCDPQNSQIYCTNDGKGCYRVLKCEDINLKVTNEQHCYLFVINGRHCMQDQADGDKCRTLNCENQGYWFKNTCLNKDLERIQEVYCNQFKTYCQENQLYQSYQLKQCKDLDLNHCGSQQNCFQMIIKEDMTCASCESIQQDGMNEDTFLTKCESQGNCFAMKKQCYFNPCKEFLSPSQCTGTQFENAHKPATNDQKPQSTAITCVYSKSLCTRCELITDACECQDEKVIDYCDWDTVARRCTSNVCQKSLDSIQCQDKKFSKRCYFEQKTNQCLPRCEYRKSRTTCEQMISSPPVQVCYWSKAKNEDEKKDIKEEKCQDCAHQSCGDADKPLEVNVCKQNQCCDLYEGKCIIKCEKLVSQFECKAAGICAWLQDENTKITFCGKQTVFNPYQNIVNNIPSAYMTGVILTTVYIILHLL